MLITEVGQAIATEVAVDLAVPGISVNELQQAAMNGACEGLLYGEVAAARLMRSECQTVPPISLSLRKE